MDAQTAIQALQSDHVQERIAAAAALIDLRTPDAFEPLLNALQDPDYRVRSWAASALGWLGDARAAGALTPLLEESPQSEWDVEVNPPTCASFALAMLGTAQPVMPMLTHNDEHVRSLAVITLRYIGDTSAIPALETVRDGDPAEWVQQLAAEAIQIMQAPDYKPLHRKPE